jgi:hypothetical protein
MLAFAHYFQTEVFADARELLGHSEEGIWSDVSVRNAASHIAQHLPVLVVSTQEKPPKCKLVNVHELQLHPEALYMLLSVDTKETEEEELQAAQNASAGVVVKFCRDHSKYACVQFEKTNAGLMCIDGKQQALESSGTQCFGCELCGCWRCAPRSFSTYPHVAPDATDSSVQCFGCELCDCLRCTVVSTPVVHGGLIGTYCSHKKCRNNNGRGCSHSGSDIVLLQPSQREMAFYTEEYTILHRYKPHWGHAYDEDGVEMVFEDGIEVQKPHGGGYAAAHQLFPQIAGVALRYLQQHSGHSAEAKRRSNESNTVGASVAAIKSHLSQTIPGLALYGFSKNSARRLFRAPNKRRSGAEAYSAVINAGVPKRIRNNGRKYDELFHTRAAIVKRSLELVALFSGISASGDEMSKQNVGTPAVSRHHQLNRMIMWEEQPVLEDHDFPNSPRARGTSSRPLAI